VALHLEVLLVSRRCPASPVHHILHWDMVQAVAVPSILKLWLDVFVQSHVPPSACSCPSTLSWWKMSSWCHSFRPNQYIFLCLDVLIQYSSLFAGRGAFLS
jgi:hypothetical protein